MEKLRPRESSHLPKSQGKVGGRTGPPGVSVPGTQREPQVHPLQSSPPRLRLWAWGWGRCGTSQSQPNSSCVPFKQRAARCSGWTRCPASGSPELPSHSPSRGGRAEQRGSRGSWWAAGETIADMLCGLSRETPGEAGKSWGPGGRNPLEPLLPGGDRDGHSPETQSLETVQGWDTWPQGAGAAREDCPCDPGLRPAAGDPGHEAVRCPDGRGSRWTRGSGGRRSAPQSVPGRCVLPGLGMSCWEGAPCPEMGEPRPSSGPCGGSSWSRGQKPWECSGAGVIPCERGSGANRAAPSVCLAACLSSRILRGLPSSPAPPPPACQEPGAGRLLLGALGCPCQSLPTLDLLLLVAP